MERAQLVGRARPSSPRADLRSASVADCWSLTSFLKQSYVLIGDLAAEVAADHARGLAHDGYARDRSVWIGEWHTHPDGPAHPSPTDLRAYLDIVRDPEETFDAFLSIIVVPAPPRPLLYAWIITKRTVEPTDIWIPRPIPRSPRCAG